MLHEYNLEYKILFLSNCLYVCIMFVLECASFLQGGNNFLTNVIFFKEKKSMDFEMLKYAQIAVKINKSSK